MDTAYGAGLDFLLISPVVVTAASAVLIARIVTAGGGAVFTLAPARALGRVSYSLYLWQTPVIVWGDVWLSGASLVVRVVLLGGAALACALASYWCVEAPIRRLGSRAKPAPAMAQPAVHA